MSKSGAKGMIFLETGNRIVRETLEAKLKEGAKQEPVDIRLSDFDGASYRIYVDPETTQFVSVSIGMRCYGELFDAGGSDMLDTEYAGLVADGVEDGYDLTLAFDVTNLPYEAEEIVEKVCCIKANLMGAPFMRVFRGLNDGTAGDMEPITIGYRDEEFIYIVPQSDRVLITYAINFKDPTDQALAKVFLQEFADAQRTFRSGPPVSFSKDPKGHLDVFSDLPEDILGYVTFIVFASHTSEDRLPAIVPMLQGFRSFLGYHIKASKSHLHTRMRTRVSSLLDELKRTRADSGVKKEKKTMSGRTFKRRA